MFLSHSRIGFRWCLYILWSLTGFFAAERCMWLLCMEKNLMSFLRALEVGIFFFMTLHSSYSVSQGTGYFFFPKAKFKKTEARPRKCSALGHSSTRLCCQHCQTWDRNQPRASGTKVYSRSHLEGEFSALSLNKAHNRDIFARTWKWNIKLTTSRPSPFYFSIHVLKWK